MMNLQRIGALLILSVFLVAPSPTFAMTMPEMLTHDGLTIQQPLLLSDTDTRALQTRTLTFGETEKIIVRKDTGNNVLAESIVSPSPIVKKSLVQKVIPVAEAAETKEAILPSATPTATPTSVPTATPEPASVPLVLQLSTGGLDAERLFSMSNSYRQSKGLPVLQKDGRSCQLAASRAPEIAGEVASGAMHSGLRARNLPYWNTENIISMRNEDEAFNWWINDTIHREAIEGNYTYSCVACHGNSCAQEFTNFQPK